MRLVARLLVVGVVCAGLYALGGFFAGPYFIERGLQRYVSQIPNERIAIGNVRVNPFRLVVQLSDVEVEGRFGAPIVSVDTAELNFRIMSVARQAIILDELSLYRPVLSLGAVARPSDVGAVIEAMPRSVLPLTDARASITRLTIEEGMLEMAGSSSDQTPMTVIDRISLSASEVSTEPITVGRYVLDIGDAEGARFQLDGERIDESQTLSGRFEIVDLNLERIAPWLTDSIMLAGTAVAKGAYELTMSSRVRSLRLADTQTSLREASLQVAETVAGANQLDVGAEVEMTFSAGLGLTANLQVRGETLELTNRSVSVSPHETHSGTASATVTVGWDEGALTINGSATLDNLDVKAAATERLRFTTAGLYLADIELRPSKLSISGARLDKPYARIVAGTAERRRSLDALAALLEGSDYTFEKLEIVDGRIDIVDSTASPPLELSARRVLGRIDASISGGDPSASIKLEGQVGESGSGTIDGRFSAMGRNRNDRLQLQLRDIDTRMLSPYFERFAGRKPTSGKLAVDLQYQIEASRVQGYTELLLEQLRLEPLASTTELPLDLAIALTEDQAGQIAVRFPVTADIDSVDALGAAFAGALRDFIFQVTESPLETLSQAVGGPRLLNGISFVPGTAQMSADSETTLTHLSQALGRRPALRLAVVGTYDANADRDALAEEQVRLHVRLATAGTATESDTQALDFSNPRTRDVLDEFSSTRLDASTLATISSRFPPAADENGEAHHSDDYYAAIFDALVDNEDVSATALRSLARFRARSILNDLLDQGVASERAQAENQDVQIVNARDGMIPTLLRLQAMSHRDTR